MWGIVLVIIGAIAYQTDWMGGAGVWGPVAGWNTQYYLSDSVTTATKGQVSLIATQWDYLAWVRHCIEENSGIGDHDQGFMGAYIDNDSLKDLVAVSANTTTYIKETVWYKNLGGYAFAKQVIGNSPGALCVYPCDMDGDDDIDVVVGASALGWFENNNLTWTWHLVDSVAGIGYHRVSAADVDKDADIDILAVDNSSWWNRGDIYLFRNDGGTFAKEPVETDFSPLADDQAWRAYLQDFNADGYPDVYSSFRNVFIFMNDGTGSFIEVYHGVWGSLGGEVDGSWPSDIDMDGDVDLVLAGYGSAPNYMYYALLNDGTGTNWTLDTLDGTNAGPDYTDGAVAADIDLDGSPDIAGTRRRVGWFRQSPSIPLTFTPFQIDKYSGAIDTNGIYDAHWIYTDVLCPKCLPSIDLLVTDAGEHIVYENQMITAVAEAGWLSSSVLELTTPDLASCDLNYFYYKACVPGDSTLAFYWRAGLDSVGVDTSAWNGPYYARTGINIIDSFDLSGDGRMFQYRAEFKKTADDMPVLYEVWMNYICSGVSVEETNIPAPAEMPLQFVKGKLVLYLPQEDNIELVIYDVAGRMVKKLFNGYLPAGKYEFEAPQKSGIYFAKISSSKGGTQKLKFIKIQ